MKYQEQLMTQEWAEFREKILDNARYGKGDGEYGPVAQCQQCGEPETRVKLHIHHKTYRNGRKAWEYETSEVKVLCADCHEHLHGIAKQIEHWLIGLSFEDAEELLSLVEAIKECGHPAAISYCKNYARAICPRNEDNDPIAENAYLKGTEVLAQMLSANEEFRNKMRQRLAGVEAAA